MSIEKFFLENNIFWKNERITSNEVFNDKCNGYEIVGRQEDFTPNNSLYLSPIDGDGKITILISGMNNVIRIGENNFIKRGLEIRFFPVYDSLPKDVTIEIGNNNYFNGTVTMDCPVRGGRRVHIGDRNLFADGVFFECRNDHGIFDKDTHELLNRDEDIFLGNRNWICRYTEFYPKAVVRNDSVVAAHALVNHAFEEDNVLLAGIPAVIKKRNIIWNVSCETGKLEENLRKSRYMTRN